MIELNRIRLAPRKFEPEQLEKNLRGILFSVYDVPTAERGPKLMKTVGEFTPRVPQLASIPKTKRQAARQPTHNGSDEDSNERNSGQRAGEC